ncbi:MAG: MCE family protein [Paraprevotella sp.]|nr:MCE family protein [Paraprevotella sp.]
MKFLTREVKIGITGVVALALLFIGINFLKGINLFQTDHKYYVVFENAKELAKSSPVYADGYNVGIVSGIHYNYQKPGHVVVEISVENALRIPKGSSAELESAMLGGCTMNLLLNNNPRERVAPGDTIIGQPNNGLMDKAATLVPKVEQIMGKVDSLLTALNKLASDPNLPIIMANTQLLTQNLNRSTEQLNKLMNNELPEIAKNVNQTTENLAQLTQDLNKLDLQGTFDKVSHTMGNVEELTDKMKRTDNTLGLLLNDTLLYSNLNETVGSANLLLKDLKEKPSRYVHFSIFGKKDK